MENKYLIYTDASADVAAVYVEQGDVTFVPMRYTVDDEERICSRPETEEFMKSFYDAQRAGKVTRTSQITPNYYVEAFEPVLKQGISVLYLCLSSGLTKTYDSVCLAARQLAEDYPDVKVIPVDTLSATGGMGLMIECAVKNRDNGMNIEENAMMLEMLRSKVAHWFMVDDLMYLKRGGRIPATSAIIGSALNIKPILEIDPEGKLITVEKKRGARMAVKMLVSKYREKKIDSMGNRVFIVHGDCQKLADDLEKQILEVNPSAEITKMMLCPVIGSHTGPGMAACIFFGERE